MCVRQRDIPDNIGFAIYVNASLASDTAAAVTSQIMVAPDNLTLASVWWTPTATTQNSAAEAGSYRNIRIVNASTGGAGTAVMASLALNASKASLTPIAITTAATSANSASKGDSIILSFTTTGGNHSDGTIIRAGVICLAYRLL